MNLFSMPLAFSIQETIEYELFPATQSNWNTMAAGVGAGGSSPSNIWLFDEANTAAVDEVASVSLSATGSPTFQVTPSAFPSEVGISMAVDTNQRLQGGTSDLNPSTASNWFYYVVQFGAAPATVVTVFEKFNASLGYALTMNTDGSLDFKFQTAAANQTISLSGNHSSSTQLIGCGRDVTNGRLRLFSGLGSQDVALTATGDGDNTGPFRIGRFLSAGMVPAIYMAHFTSSGAEGIGSTQYTNYKNHLGI